MCGGSVSKPKVSPAPAAPPIVAPMDADQTAKAAGEDERRRRMAAAGRSDTILTGGQGDVTLPEVGKKRLLGGTS